jgi:hypothetical protein
VLSVAKHWCTAQTPVIDVCATALGNACCAQLPPSSLLSVFSPDRACALMQPSACCCNQCMFALGCSGLKVFLCTLLVCACLFGNGGSACRGSMSRPLAKLCCAWCHAVRFCQADTLAGSVTFVCVPLLLACMCETVPHSSLFHSEDCVHRHNMLQSSVSGHDHQRRGIGRTVVGCDVAPWEGRQADSPEAWSNASHARYNMSQLLHTWFNIHTP